MNIPVTVSAPVVRWRFTVSFTLTESCIWITLFGLKLLVICQLKEVLASEYSTLSNPNVYTLVYGGLVMGARKRLPPIKLPLKFNYIAAFLTFSCQLRCSYCINHHGGNLLKGASYEWRGLDTGVAPITLP